MRNCIKHLKDLSCWCGNHSYRVLVTGPRRDFEILRCSQCGLVCTFPLPDSSKERYVDYSIDVYLKNKNIFIWAMKKILSSILRFKNKGRLLEIGCSVGYFLELAQKEGFDIFGLELSEKAVKLANQRLGKSVVKNYLLPEANFPDKYFDVVVMNHVLEHIMDLKNILFNIKRVLKKDGIIFIGTPNFDGFFRKITGRRWLGLRPKEHVWQFEPKTITKVLNSAGFKVLKIEKNASHNLVSLFVFRDGFSWKEFLMNILNWLFGLMGFGDNLFIIATQNDEQQKGVAN